ncbi:MAG: polyisoprenoid-binding protein YceI [Planctomycetota bacterium]|jgi:polyisoprenoid-binding protein YceI
MKILNTILFFALLLCIYIAWNTQIQTPLAHENIGPHATEQAIFHAGIYVLVPELSTLQWTGFSILGIPQRGIITGMSGDLSVASSSVMQGNIDIDLRTLEPTGLAGSTRERLQEHLLSPDFFNTDIFPKANLTIQSIRVGNPEHLLHGKLTIHGVTQPITIPFSSELSGSAYTITGSSTLDRTLWGITYNSVSTQKEKTITEDLLRDDIQIDFVMVFTTVDEL